MTTSRESPRPTWRPGRSPTQPWYVRRVRFFDAQGRRNTTFKVRWWVRPFVSVKSAPGPYFERKRDVRTWWWKPLERPQVKNNDRPTDG